MGLFDFPNPVNETAARVVAAGVATMAGTAIALDQPLLILPLVYGFAARVMAGPRFSPLGLLATKVIVPRLPGPHQLSPGPPKRLAQAMGLAFSATALLLAFGGGNKRGAYRVLGVLMAAASLEALFGICVACRLFPLLMRAGLVPEETCRECNDIWSRARAA